MAGDHESRTPATANLSMSYLLIRCGHGTSLIIINIGPGFIELLLRDYQSDSAEEDRRGVCQNN